MKALRFASWARPDRDRARDASEAAHASGIAAASAPSPSRRLLVEPLLPRSPRRPHGPWPADGR